MSRLSIPLQKKAPPHFKEIIFRSHMGDPTSDTSSSNSRQDEASRCLEILIAVLSSLIIGAVIVAVLGVCYIYFPFSLAKSGPADDAPVLIIPILLSLVFSIIFLVGVIVSGKSFCEFRPGHLFSFGSLCMPLFYIAEWLKVKNILPFEWSIICIPLYVGGGFLLVALIWFLVLCLRSSFKKGNCTAVDIEATIFGIDFRKVSNI
jgi:hypothetical protein